MRFEKPNADLLVELSRDVQHQGLIELLSGQFFFNFNFLHRINKELFDILKRVLIHLIDGSQIDNREVKNASPDCNLPV